MLYDSSSVLEEPEKARLNSAEKRQDLRGSDSRQLLAPEYTSTRKANIGANMVGCICHLNLDSLAPLES